MSRCSEWHNALTGIHNYLKLNSLIPEKRHFEFEATEKLIFKFCKYKKYKDSRSGKILFTGENFEQFKQFINNGNTTKFNR